MRAALWTGHPGKEAISPWDSATCPCYLGQSLFFVFFVFSRDLLWPPSPGSPGMAVGGTFLDLLVRLIQRGLTPHFGLYGGLVVVIAVIVHLPESLQGLGRGGPVV